MASAVRAAENDPVKLQNLASASASNLDLPPVPMDDTVNAVENTPLTIAAASLLANDADPDGDTLSITTVKGAIGGQASFDPNTNTITFIPANNFFGNASFVYTVADGKGGATDAEVNVSVAAASIGGGMGDVHYTTFDGLHYDLQATGDFLLARSTSGPAIAIEGEAEGQGVSYLKAVAIDTDGHRMIFDARTDQLSVDGSAATLSPGGLLDLGGFVALDNAAGTFTLRDSAQDIFKIFDRGSYLDLTVQPGSGRAEGSFEGLLGNYDQNPLNDLVVPGQDMRNAAVASAYLEGPFADAWRVPGTLGHSG